MGILELMEVSLRRGKAESGIGNRQIVVSGMWELGSELLVGVVEASDGPDGCSAECGGKLQGQGQRQYWLWYGVQGRR